ncbi:MAG: hypothetical protein M3O87_06350 [Candidatus Dormibacteraeota bacterium]|nr:hypothetical protein [Candidatus Dormibacteraeota bacterium]
MAKYVRVRTQAELVKVVADGDYAICVGDGRFVAWGSSHVVAWESSHVRAFGAAQVLARHAATVIATAFVAVTVLGADVTVTGGIIIRPPDIDTGPAWCEFYGVEVKAGVAVLFKAVDKNWQGPHHQVAGLSYEPGHKPKAPDWDDGQAECGGGLHFSPTAAAAAGWFDGWAHIVACPVKVEEIAAHGHGAQYPAKVKAPRVCGAIYEVDATGKRVAPARSRRKKVAAL